MLNGGGVLAVVNEKVKLLAKALPARSTTRGLMAPPMIVRL